jgi:hypothetical protein
MTKCPRNIRELFDIARTVNEAGQLLGRNSPPHALANLRNCIDRLKEQVTELEEMIDKE